MVLVADLFWKESICVVWKHAHAFVIILFSFRTTTEPYDSDQMAKEFLMQFTGQAFTVTQQLAFNFSNKKMLGVVVKSLEGND